MSTGIPAGKINQVLTEAQKLASDEFMRKAQYVKGYTPGEMAAQYGVGTLQSQQMPASFGDFDSGLENPASFGYTPYQQTGIRLPLDKKGVPYIPSSVKLAQWINLQTAINEKAMAQHEAKQRGDAILHGYEIASRNNRTMTNRMLADNVRYGDTQREQLGRDYTKRLAASDQSAMRRGLGNTTIRDAMSRGVGADYDFASSQLAGQVADRRNALYASGIERENAALRDRNTFLGSIENKGPSSADIAVARAAYAKK